MSDLLRVLYSPQPNPQRLAPADPFLPRGHTKDAITARQAISDYLAAQMMRPLHASDEDFDRRVKAETDSMTLAERVFVEIEMTQRNRTFYSADYDPLAY